MQLFQIKNKFVENLVSQYGREESEQFFYMLSETYLKYSKVDIALNYRIEIDLLVEKKIQQAAKRLKQWEPIQYIIGAAYFYGNTFIVNSNTLIPRPETEELIDWVISDFKDKKVKILDIGTGSGCIAISVALNLATANVFATDISLGALVTANKNAEQLKAKVQFEQQDILGATSLTNQFDVVISNPPYVRNLEKEKMSLNVLNHEPASALFVEDSNPLIFYKKIAQLFLAQAKKNAVLYFEINEYLGKQLKEYLKKLEFKNIELRKDFRGKDRMLKATL